MESGLSIGYPDLVSEVGHFLGYGRDDSGWSVARVLEVDKIIQSGIRRVYYPPAVNAGTIGYEWSWLRPSTTLSVVSGTSDYDLPDDFGRLVGSIHYPANQYRKSLSIISIGQMLELRARIGTAVSSGYPTCAATRYKTSTGATGQRQEVLLYPTPGSDLEMPYEYEAYSGAISDTYPYPLGGMQLAELYIESCLAVAENRLNDEIGIHTPQYQALLVDAISRDMSRGCVQFGNMGNKECSCDTDFRRGISTSPITYNGVEIE